MLALIKADEENVGFGSRLAQEMKLELLSHKILIVTNTLAYCANDMQHLLQLENSTQRFFYLS